MAWKNTEIPFDSVSELAYIIVDDVIKSAVQVVTEEQLVKPPKEAVAEPKHAVRNIQWIMCKNFTTARGLLQIEEYIKVKGPHIYHLDAFDGNSLIRILKSESCLISYCTAERILFILSVNKKTWELHESWLHWTSYLEDEELQYSTRYHYRVRWSIPTCRKPIPRATANVYFIIEISKIKPNTLPVEVFFVVETNRLIHRPGECRFKEKWLKDVIESKITLMEKVNF